MLYFLIPYQKWFNTTAKQVQSKSDLTRYLETLAFGLVLFGIFFAYTTWMNIPNALNKVTADIAVILMGLSMLLSSICYFWDFADTKIVYRKHLGLVGFGFGVLHTAFSWSALLALFYPTTWKTSDYQPLVAGAIALVIFVIMALISNRYAANALGGSWWRRILRTGYLALFFVLLHVFWLKSARWITWIEDGMDRPPALSLVVAVFIGVVIFSRLLLWVALARSRARQA